MPRVKPPFPAGAGVFMKPSNVNNVETYANAPSVVEQGASWYVQQGTERMRGTRLFSFSGDINRVGFMEIPFGVPLAGVLEAVGGILPGHTLKAIQSGGPLGSMLPAREVPNLSMENAPFSALDALMGGGGIVFLSDRICTIHMAEMFTQFVEEESCGRCTTCHGGNQRQTEIIRRTISGEGRHEDRHNLALLDRTLQFSNCVHGQFSPKIVRNTLRFFSDEYERHSAGRTCDALECEGLIRFRIVNQQDPRLAEAQDICPVAAITGSADPRLATRSREGLVRRGQAHATAEPLARELQRRLGRQLRLRVVDAGDCGGCGGELEAAMQADVQAVTSEWDLANEPFERVLVKPKRGGVAVQLVGLVWVPSR